MTIEVRAPFDGRLIDTVETSGADAVEAALETAYRLFRDRSAWLQPAKRVEILRQTARLMTDQAEHLAVEAAREGGKPLIDSRAEVARAIDGVLNASELLRSEGGSVVPMGGTPASLGRIAFTTHEPIGVVVAVSAFNHPLNLIVHAGARSPRGERTLPARCAGSRSSARPIGSAGPSTRSATSCARPTTSTRTFRWRTGGRSTSGAYQPLRDLISAA